MRAMKTFRNICLREEGGITVEYVAVAMPFFILFFFIFEVAMAYFWSLSVEKATYLGTRVAVVRDPAAQGMPTRNLVTASGVNGLPCNHPTAPCATPSPSQWTCVAGGAGCSAGAFNNILAEMRRLWPGISASNVTITYTYTGLGFAGGPLIPTVAVDAQNVPFGMAGLATLRSLFTNDTAIDVVPHVRVMMTGEDLTSAGG